MSVIQLNIVYYIGRHRVAAGSGRYCFIQKFEKIINYASTQTVLP